MTTVSVTGLLPLALARDNCMSTKELLAMLAVGQPFEARLHAGAGAFEQVRQAIQRRGDSISLASVSGDGLALTLGLYLVLSLF